MISLSHDRHFSTTTQAGANPPPALAFDFHSFPSPPGWALKMFGPLALRDGSVFISSIPKLRHKIGVMERYFRRREDEYGGSPAAACRSEQRLKNGPVQHLVRTYLQQFFNPGSCFTTGTEPVESPAFAFGMVNFAVGMRLLSVRVEK